MVIAQANQKLQQQGGVYENNGTLLLSTTNLSSNFRQRRTIRNAVIWGLSGAPDTVCGRAGTAQHIEHGTLGRTIISQRSKTSVWEILSHAL